MPRTVTLQSHILQQDALPPAANGAVSWILSALSISAKVIAARVRRARLDEAAGDPQRKLDAMANEVLMRTIGAGVDMFVLDPSIGAFLRVAEKLSIPDAGRTYSVNEGHRRSFPAGFQRYLDWAQAHDYSCRYVGALVADAHRILLKGGVFLYPPTAKAPQGKLRLMYEANPMAMLIEQAGGKALAGPDMPILSIAPKDIKQRTPVILGSTAEVEHVLRHLRRG